MSFYQISDKVSCDVITGVTSNCDRQDCKISARMGETTLSTRSEYYDKQGILHVNDPNRFVVDLCCCKCWKKWKVNEKGKEVST